MASETIDAFWNECESDLNTYTNQFNEQMNEFGFHETYIVVDKNPIGLGLWSQDDIQRIDFANRLMF